MKKVYYYISYLKALVEYHVFRMHRKPLHPIAIEALRERLENLKKFYIRKYEQNFLEKFLKNCKSTQIN